tara:strand:+ start:1598 stop:2692 length:1095 start_codon:yes stop_codon:yes gene_type:complete
MELENHLDYLFKSLQHHPSPYLICEKDGTLKWVNIASEYIFRLKEINEIQLKNFDPKNFNSNLDDEIASSYSTSIELNLRNINFFIRARIHIIPSENSEFLLIEVLCESRDSLNALKDTISCIEYDRIDLAYQKQFDLKTGEITGVEALLRLKDENGNILPNDKIIPQIEGESLFSLVVKSSLEKLSELFNVRNKLGLTNATIYLNVSAYTIMHPEFNKIFSNFVDNLDIKSGEFGLEVTETAELTDTKRAKDFLTKLKNKGIKIALDDFGAGYASLKYVKDLPLDVVKLDKQFTNDLDEESTKHLIKFVVEVCNSLSLQMIGEGIETNEQKSLMKSIGCDIGQGFLMHKPEFLEDLLKKESYE